MLQGSRQKRSVSLGWKRARLDCVLDPMLDQVCCRNIKRLAGNEA